MLTTPSSSSSNLSNPPKTYANALSQNASNAPDLRPEIATYKGEIAIKFSQELIDYLAIPFRYALVGKFSQGKPPLDAIKKFLNVQNFAEPYSVGVLDAKHVLINFSGERDFIRLFSKSQWFVTSKPMRILKWTPNFHVDVESSIVPIWILMPKLPAHLMKPEILREIISPFGNLLRVDSSTATLKRPSVARVQVEIDLLKTLPKRVWIQQGEISGFWQLIELENELPQYCSYCCHLGHTEAICRIKHPEIQSYEQQNVDAQTKDTETSKTSNGAFKMQNGQIWKPKQTQGATINKDDASMIQTQSSIINEDDAMMVQQSLPNPNDKQPVNNMQQQGTLEHMAPSQFVDADTSKGQEARGKTIEESRIILPAEDICTSKTSNLDAPAYLEHKTPAPAALTSPENLHSAVREPHLKNDHISMDLQSTKASSAEPQQSDTSILSLPSDSSFIKDPANEVIAPNGSSHPTCEVIEYSQNLDVAANQGPETVPTITEGSATVKEGVLLAAPISSVTQAIEYSEGCPISNSFEILSVPSTKQALKSSGIHSQASIQAELRYMSLDPKPQWIDYISDEEFEEKFTPAKKPTRTRKKKQIFDL